MQIIGGVCKNYNSIFVIQSLFRYLLPDKNKKTKKKTTPRKGTVNPFWEEEFRWSLPNFAEHMQRTLEITLWNKQSASSSPIIGRTSLTVIKQQHDSFNFSDMENWYWCTL